MIRGVIGLFFFAIALCAYIVLSPGDSDADTRADALQSTGVDVTRGVVQNPLPTMTEAVVNSTAPAQDPIIAPTPHQETERAFEVVDDSIEQTASSILAGLGLETAGTAPSTDDPLAQMTGDVLANIVAITGGQLPHTAPTVDTALEQLVVDALRDGTVDSEIDKIVNDAALAGELSVPRILVTEGGKVDTAVLLKSIITQAQVAAGQPAPAVPDVPSGDGTGVEVRVVQRATETEQYRFYTVNTGDSLGSIAVKFYGSVNRYPVIFEANRAILSSPDRIRVGQRLAIPKFPEEA